MHNSCGRSAGLCRCAVVAGVAAMLALLVCVAPGMAQTFRGTILGTVTDTTGATIVGAKVTIRNVDTGLERTTDTVSDGSYLVPELPVGLYDVTIEMSGFQKSVTKGVKVDIAAERRVDATLRPGALSQQVVVSGEDIPQIETTT